MTDGQTYSRMSAKILSLAEINNHNFVDLLNCNADSPRVTGLTAHIALNGTPMTELLGVTCRMGSHSVTCYPTQVNVPLLNPSPQAGILDLTTPEG